MDQDNSHIFREHKRRFDQNRYVYPVVSRRSRGVSIGVNLSPGKICNYRCVYCQVDRDESTRNTPDDAKSSPGGKLRVDIDLLRSELEETVALTTDGRLFEQLPFSRTPDALRRFNDIAFSGDGEPTLCPQFGEAVEIASEIRKRLAPDSVKLVLITNATRLDRPQVSAALDVMDCNNGEIWAKLDAGTQEYHQRVLRSNVTLDRVVSNISEAAKCRPIVIQTLFLKMQDESPSKSEIQAYIRRLQEIQNDGGLIKLVQVHTIARAPSEVWATSLPNEELDAIVDRIREETGLTVEGYYG
jgi:wyosine [tRNA(Phe)-imidazoG37] synthetase (radical SAM superfamily)